MLRYPASRDAFLMCSWAMGVCGEDSYVEQPSHDNHVELLLVARPLGQLLGQLLEGERHRAHVLGALACPSERDARTPLVLPSLYGDHIHLFQPKPSLVLPSSAPPAPSGLDLSSLVPSPQFFPLPRD